jgi:hypothetical protein
VRALVLLALLQACGQRREAPGPSERPIDHGAVQLLPDAAPPPGPKVFKHMRGADIAAAFLSCARTTDETKLGDCYAADARADVADEDLEATGPADITARLYHVANGAVADLSIEPQLTLIAGSNVASILLARGHRLAIYGARTATFDDAVKIAVEKSYVNGADVQAQLKGGPPHKPVPDSLLTRRVLVAQGTPAEDAEVVLLRRSIEQPAAELYADGAVSHDQLLPADLPAAKALAQRPALKATVDDAWAAGPFAVASASLAGELKGKSIQAHELVFVRAAGGKIAEEWIFADGSALR